MCGCAALAKQLNNQTTKQPKDQTTKRQLCNPIPAIMAIGYPYRPYLSKKSQKPSTENVPTS